SEYSESVLDITGECHLENYDDDENLDCANDEDLRDDVLDAADKLRRRVKKCDDDAFRAICPLQSKTVDQLVPNVLNGPTSYTASLDDILHRLFAEDHSATGCPRPGEFQELHQDYEDCAEGLNDALVMAIEELQKCFFGCMQSELQAPLS